MRLGILSDTHDEVRRTHHAVSKLRTEGADAIVHCGDICGPAIIAECAILPLFFALGNRDCDMAHILRDTAMEHGATCLCWGGEFTIADTRIAVVHGHLTRDLRPLLEAKPDYLLSGHSHSPRDWHDGVTRRINPGALADADEYSVAILDLDTATVQFIPILH